MNLFAWKNKEKPLYYFSSLKTIKDRLEILFYLFTFHLKKNIFPIDF